MSIDLALPKKNIEASVVNVGTVKLYFSYETLIAVYGQGIMARVENTLGSATWQNIKDLGCESFPIANEEDLQAFAMYALRKELCRGD